MLNLAHTMFATALIKNIWTQLLHADNRQPVRSVYLLDANIIVLAVWSVNPVEEISKSLKFSIWFTCLA